MSRQFFGFCIILLAFSCGNKNKSVLPISEMRLVMWDMINADSWFTITSYKDSLAVKNKKNITFYKQIFQQHNTTKEQFYYSYNYYEQHPDEMKTLLDSVEATGSRAKIKLLGKAKPTIKK